MRSLNRNLIFILILGLGLVIVILGGLIPALANQQPRPFSQTASVKIGGPNNLEIRPLLGVNCGPLPAGRDPNNAELTRPYQEIGVTLVRTHDYYGPLDTALMYPDRTKNPADPSSYNFSASDRTWKAIVEGGFKPYFRLGDSWNNSRPPANPFERENWVKAALEVLNHYRRGKWSGFQTKFRYVEIWNEPDHQQFWPKPHTPRDYFQLYHEAAVAIKKEFPDIQVGGPAITHVYKIDDACDKLQLSTLDTPEFEMSAYGVYFLIFK